MEALQIDDKGENQILLIYCREPELFMEKQPRDHVTKYPRARDGNNGS